MKARALGAAVLLALVPLASRAESGPAKSKKAAAPAAKSAIDPELASLGARLLGLDEKQIGLELVQKLLPRGWRIETTNLAPGVAGLALGPAENGVRPVIVLSRVDAKITRDAPFDGPGARAYVARILGADTPGLTVTATSAVGLLGGPEVIAQAPGVEEPLVLRYAFTREPPGWLLTIAAPMSKSASIQGRIEAFVAPRTANDGAPPGTTVAPVKKL